MPVPSAKAEPSSKSRGPPIRPPHEARSTTNYDNNSIKGNGAVLGNVNGSPVHYNYIEASRPSRVRSHRSSPSSSAASSRAGSSRNSDAWGSSTQSSGTETETPQNFKSTMGDLRAGTKRSGKSATQDVIESSADGQSQTYTIQRLEYLIYYYENKIYSHDDLKNKVRECQEELDNLKNYKGRTYSDRNWLSKYNVLVATLYRLDGWAHFWIQRKAEAKSKHDMKSDIKAYEYIGTQYQEAMEFLDDCEWEGNKDAVALANLKFQRLRVRVHQVVAFAYYSLRLLEHGDTCGALQKGRIAVGDLQSIEEGQAQLIRENLVETDSTAFEWFGAFLEVAKKNVDDVVARLGLLDSSP